VRKKNTNKRDKNSDFDIFSDDSLDNILLELPSTGVPAPYPSLDKHRDELATDILVERTESFYHDSGFFDETQAVPESSPVTPAEPAGQPSTSRETNHRSVTKDAKSPIPLGAAVTSICADKDPETFQDLLEYHVRKQNQAIEKKFMGQTSSRRENALFSLKRNWMGANSRSQSEPLAATSLSENPRTSNSESATTGEAGIQLDMEANEKLRKTFMYQSLSQQVAALKRMGSRQIRGQESNAEAAALGLGVSQKEPKETMTPRQRLGQQALRNIKQRSRADKMVPEQFPLTMESDKPVERVIHPMALGTADSTTGKGSEDLVVPNSEDENESDGSEVTAGDVQAPFDLARFAFKPR
jgi:hypothetical protein